MCNIVKDAIGFLDECPKFFVGDLRHTGTRGKNPEALACDWTFPGAGVGAWAGWARCSPSTRESRAAHLQRHHDGPLRGMSRAHHALSTGTLIVSISFRGPGPMTCYGGV